MTKLYKKTIFLIKKYDNKLVAGENKFMIKDKLTNQTTTNEKPSTNLDECTVHVMPPQITDDDINALFAGIVSIMRRKIELETKAEIINSTSNYAKVLAELKAKQAECNRLKNEIIHLKSLLDGK